MHGFFAPQGPPGPSGEAGAPGPPGKRVSNLPGILLIWFSVG